MPKPDVSIIVNAHNEGTLLHKSLRSLSRNIVVASEQGITTEVIIVADKVDNITKDYLDSRVDLALGDIAPIVEYVSYGDLGLSRNHGIQSATADIVGNLDGDDIWSDNWISSAVQFLRKYKDRRIIVHQETVISFGAKNNVWHVKSSTDPKFTPRSLVEDNWWQSNMMTYKDNLIEVPYRETLRRRDFSFEDWLWNCDTLNAGMEHIVVPGTTWFYRRKPVSMLTQQLDGLLSSTPLLTPAGIQKYESNKKKEATARVSTQTIVNAGNIRPPVSSSIKKGVKKTLKKGAKAVYPLVAKRPRIENYLRKLVYETAVLINGERKDNLGVAPEYTKRQWKEVGDIDSGLFPTAARLSTLENREMISMGDEQHIFWDLSAKIGEEADYVIFTPWLKTSGASLVVLHYARAYKQLHPDANIVVVGTEKVESPWASKLPKGVRFETLNERFFEIEEEEQSKVIAKVLVQLKPKNLHIIHSQEAFRAVQSYAAQVSLHTKIYMSAFNYEFSKEGMRQSSFLMYAEPALPYVTKVFTDNEWIIQDSILTYGLSDKLFETHAMPYEDSGKNNINLDDKFNGEKLQILWAGRIAKQKRPDILYKIAKRSLALAKPFEFTVYGELYGATINPQLLHDLVKLKNVRYMGAFSNGIPGLPLSNIDAYLSTSEAEGAPNAIIEAQAMGLIAVAPSVGGIPEVVLDGKTGHLVEDFTDIDGYIASLDKVWSDKDASRKAANTARENILANRNWDSFVDLLKKEFN